jgi:hypothetical protein
MELMDKDEHEQTQRVKSIPAGRLQFERARLSRRGTGRMPFEILDKVQYISVHRRRDAGRRRRPKADEAARRRPGLKVVSTTGYTRSAIVCHGRLDPRVELWSSLSLSAN